MPEQQEIDEIQNLLGLTNSLVSAPPVADVVNAAPPVVNAVPKVDNVSDVNEIQAILGLSPSPKPDKEEEISNIEAIRLGLVRGVEQLKLAGTVVPLLVRDVVAEKSKQAEEQGLFDTIGQTVFGEPVKALVEIALKPFVPLEDSFKAFDEVFEKEHVKSAKERFARIESDPKSKEAHDKIVFIRDVIRSATPQNIEPLSFKGISGSVTEAMVGNILPMIGVSLIAGPKAGAAFFGTQAFANQFADSTLRGRSLEQSIVDGFTIGIAEAVSEKLVLGKLMEPGKPFLKRVLGGTITQATQEMLMEGLNIGLDIGEFDETITLQKALERIVHSGIIGGIIGGKMAAIFHPTIKSSKIKTATTTDSFHESQSKLLDEDKVDPGGLNMTQGEKSRLSFVKEHLTLLNTVEKTPEVQQSIDLFNIELADLEDKTLTEIDQNGQVLIKGITIADIDNSTTLTEAHDPVLLGQVADPENDVAPINANNTVDSKMLAKLLEKIDNIEQGIDDGKGRQIKAQETWSVNEDPQGMVDMVDAYGQDVEYQVELHNILDTFFPDSNTIIMYHGHRPGRAPYTDQEKLTRKVGNASIDPSIAMTFAYSKIEAQIFRQGIGSIQARKLTKGENFRLKDAVATVIEVPKSAIKAVNTRMGQELEFIFETETVKHRGQFKFLDYVNGLSSGKEKSRTQHLESLKSGIHVQLDEADRIFREALTLGQKLPVERITAEGQVGFAGFGETVIQPTDIGPEQLDFLGTFDESLAPEQMNLGLADIPTINIDTGAFKEVPSSQKGTRGGSVWQHGQSGTKYFVKMIGEIEAHNEVLVSELYKLPGINVPKTHFAVHDGQIGVASRIVDQAETVTDKIEDLIDTPGLVDNFIFDAWLGNHDVIGLEFDNIMIEETPLGPRILRLDFGGALNFRAGGNTKEFTERVIETESMRDSKAAHRPSVKVFGHLSDATLASQASLLQDISDTEIFQTVQKFGPPGQAARTELSRILIARKKDILTRFPPPVGAPSIEQSGPAPGSMDRIRQMGVGQKSLSKIFLKQRGGILPENSRGVQSSDTPVQAKKRALLEQDKYNWWTNLTWTISQMAKKNRHIQPLVEYWENQSFMANTKMEWIARAEQRVRQWQGLYKGQADALSNLLFDVQEMTYLKADENKVARQPTNEELAVLVDKHKLKPEAIEMYFLIRQDFLDVLDAIEEAEIEAARKNFTDTFILNEKIREIRRTNELLRQKPYFPMSRFGEFTIVVKDDDIGGKVIYMESFEGTLGKLRANRRFKEVKKMFPGKNIRQDIIIESMQPFRSLPPSVKGDIIRLLDLDIPIKGTIGDSSEAKLARKREAERAEKLNSLEQILFEHDNVQSFKKHFERRKGTPGYSKDALRNYADYFFRGANHIARVKHVNELDESIQKMEDEIKLLKDIPESPIRDRRRILAYMKDHREYILNPENDLANLRALGFVWFLGFVPKSAVINLTQVPLVAAPYLSSRYNELAATAELGRAIKDLRSIYKNDPSARVTEEKLKGINLGIQMGFLEESQAMELAAMSTSSVLQRALPGNKIQRGLREVQYASAYMFQTAEKMNRRIVFSAAWELAHKNPETPYLKELLSDNPRLVSLLKDSGWAQKDILGYLAGKDAVDTTQYEYASWNRPRFMRGKKSVIFLFFQYLQNTLFFFNNAPGRGRALLLLLLVAGIEGMPGAEDMEEFVKWFGRQIDKDWNPEKAFREYVTEVSDIDPDIFLHGASRESFGLAHVGDLTGLPIPSVDLSGSLSFGRLIPGAQGILQPGDFEHKFLATSTDAGGAVISGAMGIAQAMADKQNADGFKRWERAMPSQLRNMSKAFRRYRQEGEFARTGAEIADVMPEDPEHFLELVMQAGGFPTTRITKEWDRIRMQQESAMFWNARKKVLLSAFDKAARLDDEEGMSDTRTAMKKYNNEVPFRSMAIGAKVLRDSRKARHRTRERQEAGLLPQRNLRGISEETNKLFPSSPVHEERIDDDVKAYLKWKEQQQKMEEIQKLLGITPPSTPEPVVEETVETLR
jgi:hypothetical protein